MRPAIAGSNQHEGITSIREASHNGREKPASRGESGGRGKGDAPTDGPLGNFRDGERERSTGALLGPHSGEKRSERADVPNTKKKVEETAERRTEPVPTKEKCQIEEKWTLQPPACG